MTSSHFWDQKSLSRTSVPTLQELLRCCDEDLLVRVIIDEHAVLVDGPPSAKRRCAMQKRLGKTLVTMRTLSLKKKAGRSRVMLPEETFVLQGHTGLIKRCLSASLVSLDKNVLKTCVNSMAANANAQAEVTVAGCSPPSFAFPDGEEWPVRLEYTLDPWEKTLASRVWLAGTRCSRERYLVLASAVWEMTFFGFEYERVAARQAQKRAQKLLGVNEANTVSEKADQADVGGCDLAQRYGLACPDPFESEYRICLAERVEELNRQARADFRLRYNDLVRKLANDQKNGG